MKKSQRGGWTSLALVLLALACSLSSAAAQSEPSRGAQFIFTSDPHYGITRKDFRGAQNVSARVVNAALVAELNHLGAMRIPTDGGVRAGELVGAIDFVAVTGDIANRAEKGLQPAAASWKDFAVDYIDGLHVTGSDQRKSALLLAPGNHDASNAVGFRNLLTPRTDASSMLGIYNMMMNPSLPLTRATYDYRRDRVHYSRDVRGVHLVILHIWPDSAERAWLERDLRGAARDVPVLLFTHDPPVSDPKHFLGSGAASDSDRFENLLSERLKDRSQDGTEIEQRELAAFLKAHPNVRAYFHGHANFNDMYVWRGPDNDVALPVFRADSPMKGKVSATDESKLSFQFVSIDDGAKRMTVREVLWNAAPVAGSALRWGTSATVPLR